MNRLLLAEMPDLPMEAFTHIGDKKIKPQKGGGGGSQTVTQQTYPKVLEPKIVEAAELAQQVAALPYVGYGGERIAQFTPEQLYVQRAVMGLGRPEELPQAAQATRQTGQLGYSTAATGLSRALGFQPGTFSRQTAQYYMSPYQQAVTDSALREAERSYGMEQRRANLQAGARGGLGGSAQALREAEAARNYGTLRSDIQAKGAQAAFEQAQTQFERDRGAAAAAAQLAGQVGTSGLGQMGSAAGQLADIGRGIQATDLERLQAQGNVGQQIQQRNQQMMSLAYEDFLRQRGYPQEQAAFYSNLLRGLPIQQAGTSTVTTSAANPAAQGVGALLQLLGQSRAFG